MHLFSVPKRGAACLRRNLILALCCSLIASCASTGNNFDQTRVGQIRKGETSEADLVKMFGTPGNRTTNAEGVTTLMWMYSEATVKGESFIPYAGAFMGGTRGSAKSLSVTLVADKVTDYTLSGSAGETRNMTQSTPKS